MRGLRLWMALKVMPLRSGEGRVTPHNTGCVLHGSCSIAIKGDCWGLGGGMSSTECHSTFSTNEYLWLKNKQNGIRVT